MAAVYLEQWVDGPLVDYHAIGDGFGDWGPHFWINQNRSAEYNTTISTGSKSIQSKNLYE